MTFYQNQLEMTGYQPVTTFWDDFSIADRFGVKAVKDTYVTAFNGWKHDYVYLTELVLILNWKIWQYYETNYELAVQYNKLWEKLSDWCLNHLKGEELSYYLRTTD